jgi:hypothetical protein
MPRLAIIGAFGGDQQKSAGEEFGAAVVEAGYILLTGGDIRYDDEIKNATMIGAKCAENNKKGVARLIGILPNGIQKPEEKKWLRPNPRRLFLNTGLKHNERNVINGVTPDVAVVFGGGAGTLAEAAFAKAAGKQLIFYGDALARLSRNLPKYFSKPNEFDTYLRNPLAVYPKAFEDKYQTPESLKALLETTLGDAAKTGCPEDMKTLLAMVKNAVNRLGSSLLTSLTDFPGLPNDLASKDKFEGIVVQISS